MPLPRKWNKKKRVPDGFDYIEPVLEALENELRDKVKESNMNKRRTEAIWPVHQINWQKSRYVYDMYYVHKKISKQVYDYCVTHKLIDVNLIAKWKKPGYERLCSTYVINPSNYKFGTTSICRVPLKDRSQEQKLAKDPTTGCMGCASGKGAGPRNIFGNKYGQNLAAVQVAREQRLQAKAKQEEEVRLRKQKQEEERQKQRNYEGEEEQETDSNDDDDASTDDDSEDDDDFGPSPAAGIWAGSAKLQTESEKIAFGDNNTNDDDDAGEEETDEDDDDEYGAAQPPNKKVRQEE